MGVVVLVVHLIGTAVGWGGLPEYEASYPNDHTHRPAGRDRLTLHDVPVDAFWSLSIYNRDGFFEPNPWDSYSVNRVTAVRANDGSVVIDLGPEPTGDEANFLAVMDGWNWTLRLYRPRPEALDGTWTMPEFQAI